MVLTFDSGTTQQRAWCQRVIDESSFPWDDITTLSVNVAFVSDPGPTPHAAYAYTTDTIVEGNYHAQVDMRHDLGDTSQDYDLFTDVFHHELGHAYMPVIGAPSAALTPLFKWGDRVGSVDFWDPLDQPWEHRILEAVAETFKDTFAATQKWWNRNFWKIQRENFDAFAAIVMPATTPPVEGTLSMEEGFAG